MHTADWSNIPELAADAAAAHLADADAVLAKSDDLPAQRHPALTLGYLAFWAGAPFAVPEGAAARNCGALWSRGYATAHRAACRDGALPIASAHVRAGMTCDRGRCRVSGVSAQPHGVTIEARRLDGGGATLHWKQSLAQTFWVNSAPRGTLARLSRALSPEDADGLDTWPGLEGALSYPLTQDHPMTASAKTDKSDREATAQASEAAQRDREKTSMARAQWVSPAPVAEDTWTPRGPGLCHALAEYCERTGTSTSDLAHRCQAKMGGATVRQWISGLLPVKIPISDIAAALGLSVRTANRLWLRQWVAGARETYVMPGNAGEVIVNFMLDRGYSFEDMARESEVAEQHLRGYVATGKRPKADVHARLSAFMGDGWHLPTYKEAPTPPPGRHDMPSAEDRAGRLAAFAANPVGTVPWPTGTVHKLTPARAPAKAAPPAAAEVAPREPVVHDGEVHHAVPAAPERKLSAVERLVLAAEKGLITEVAFGKGYVTVDNHTTNGKTVEGAAEIVLAKLLKDAAAAAAAAQRNLGMLGG